MQPVELCNAAVGITSGSGSISDDVADVAKKMAKGDDSMLGNWSKRWSVLGLSII